MKIFFLLFSILALSAHARDLPTADPAALEAAISTAAPGDTIIMSDGTWADAKIIFRAQGTAEAPITLRAQTPGQVILSGQSQLSIAGSHLIVDGLLFKDGSFASSAAISFRGKTDEFATDCRVTNTAIIDYNPPLAEAKSSVWVSLYGSRNRVDHCLFKGKNNESPLMIVWLNGGEPNQHRIDSNFFRDRTFNGKNGGETIRVGDSKTSLQISRTVVENNLFESCDGEVEIISNKSCENIYRGNTFRGNAGTLTLRHGNRCLVEGNYFLGAGKQSSGGVRIIGVEHRVLNNYFADLTGEGFYSAIGFMACIPNSLPNEYVQVKKAVVAFNTVVNCRSTMLFGIGFGSRNRILPAEDCTIANNILVGQAAPLITFLVQPTQPTWEGNIAFGAATGLASQGLREQDPELVQGADGLWQLAQDSPALGQATGHFPEIASHNPGATLKSPPLTAKDAGPSWSAL
ncbi:polysaccharide lyase 6 family protein [soil metagenome]